MWLVFGGIMCDLIFVDIKCDVIGSWRCIWLVVDDLRCDAIGFLMVGEVAWSKHYKFWVLVWVLVDNVFGDAAVMWLVVYDVISDVIGSSWSNLWCDL